MSSIDVSIVVTPPHQSDPLTVTLSTLLPHTFKASPVAFSQSQPTATQSSKNCPSNVSHTLTLYTPFKVADDLSLVHSLLRSLDLIDNDEVLTDYNITMHVSCSDPSSANAEASTSYVKTVCSQLKTFIPTATVKPDTTTQSTTLSPLQSKLESTLLTTSSILEASSQISMRSGSFTPTDPTSQARRCQLLTLLPLLESYQDSPASVVLAASAVDSFLSLDPVSVQSINLLPPPGPSSSTDSIYSIFAANTASHYGKSTLKEWCQNPSTDLKVIDSRQDIVQFFDANAPTRDRLTANLRGLPNLHSITRKVKSNKGGLKELYHVYTYANILPQIVATLQDEDCSGETASLKSYVAQISTVSEQLANLRNLAEAVIDMKVAPADFFVNRDFSQDTAELRDEIDDTMEKIKEEHAATQAWWSSETGQPLNTVRLMEEEGSGYGYKFRIPNTNEEKRLRDYKHIHVSAILKSGVTFQTKEMKDFSQHYASLKSDYAAGTKEIVMNAMEIVATYLPILHQSASIVGAIDSLMAFAKAVAFSPGGYCRPTMSTDKPGLLKVSNGRHPCVELQSSVQFIPNDYAFSREEGRFTLLTGPNMGGKSTYIRGLGAIVVMAQMGSFVPAEEAEINVVDNILCRVGAGDLQGKGISTFMAEMLESSSILNRATDRSLVIIDELGRGTSTRDGFGLAYAIARYIVQEVKCATIFATHFHELTAMEDEFKPLVNNKHVSAEKPSGGELTFLYKVLNGPCLQSFGIDVAEMAGMVKSVVVEAKRKAKELEHFEYKGRDEQVVKRFKGLSRVSMEGSDEDVLKAVREALE